MQCEPVLAVHSFLDATRSEADALIQPTFPNQYRHEPNHFLKNYMLDII